MGCTRGHLLLFVDSKGGYYFHVAGGRDHPYYMTQSGYERYLRESKKRELRRIRLSLPKPAGAAERMEQLMSGEWLWLMLSHNCVAFVESILAAGGSNWGSYSNCPSIAVADSIETRVNAFVSQLEGQICSIYGAPR